MREHLTGKDLRKLSTFIRDLYVLRTHDEFSTHLVAAIPSITEGEFTSYNEINLTHAASTFQTDVPFFLRNPEHYGGILATHAKTHPILTQMEKTQDGRAVTFSDVLPTRTFRNSTLYHEFYKPLRIPYIIGIALDIDPQHSITIARHRAGREFSEKTRTILNAIRPHLLQAFTNAQAVSRTQEALTSVTQTLDQTGHAVIALTAHGKILWATPRAHALLLEFGLKHRPGSDRLPSLLHEWVTERHRTLRFSDEPAAPGTPLVLTQGIRQLHIRLMGDTDGHKLILEEQGGAPPWEQLEELGLAHREAEVLAWTAQGKTNEEIGKILGCSRRTVQKHLERIYVKLGVENRTAAATVAIDAARASRTTNGTGT